MSKKQIVKMLLELTSTFPNIPTNSDNSLNLEKFYKVSEIAAMITLLKYLKVDSKWLQDKGFIPAYMIYGPELDK